MRLLLLRLSILFLAVLPAHASVVRMAAPALERTLARQLFNQPGPDGAPGRYYLRGNGQKGCSVYADTPHVVFEGDRVVVSVKTHAKLGLGKLCFGLTVTFDSEVSFIPEAEGESVGFRDARIDHVTKNKELDLLLEPFLSKKLPDEMKINAADLMRKLLVKSPDSVKYVFTLESLKLTSMQVEGQYLVINLDADFRVD